VGGRVRESKGGGTVAENAVNVGRGPKHSEGGGEVRLGKGKDHGLARRGRETGHKRGGRLKRGTIPLDV